ncbi:MAG: prephenate dehydrogenase/arogenate dehydrogenase family protein [Bacteroidales bacterium]|nr:prephenate dehydrogenase/arogenate dehydrogenase family protein [Anaerotignum sp.]MCI5678920.1 prephenate dehydrogenase/arogenate dehydrogenase family protein [Bacteroidales bacterium]MDY3927403.1 prephenate dehydrogenase/arogenate dehydrogenase family protein [Anaerotignum sp.]
MKVGVVGLGLIGGSMAKAVKKKTEHEVIGWDISETIRYSAILMEAVHGFMEEGNPKDCDIVLIALYPQMTVDYIKEHAKDFKKGAVVVDCAGIKRAVCRQVQSVAEENGFSFVGAHPMAGVERSGFTYSTADMFNGATLIVTPYTGTDIGMMNALSMFFKKLGFAKLKVATDAEHDQMIAYTSQLAHVVSSAYVKGVLSSNFKDFSGGSFQDMTRVARLNENMWTELFLANGDNLANEIDGLIERMQAYSKAIRAEDADTLRQLLKEGREKCIAIDEDKEFD